MNARPLLAAAALAATVAAVPPAAAQVPAFDPPAGGLADVAGPRALALGGGAGVASGNDGIFVNPGATAARRRYSVEGLVAVDRRGGADAGKYVGATVVDALSSPVAASFAWVRPLEGFQGGNLFVVGLAGAVADRAWLGVQGRYLAVREEDAAGAVTRVNAVTADAGLYWEVSDLLSIGVAGFNLVPTGHERSAPRALGAGLAVGSDTSLKLTADWRADFDRARDAADRPRTTNRYGLGLEVFLGAMVPVRAGWQRDETLDTSWWSAGAGLVAPSGVGLDVGYRQSLTKADAREVVVAFKVQGLEL